MTEIKQKVLTIRTLAEKGYREKMIRMITGANQPHINKIVNGKLHTETKLEEGEELVLTEEQKERLSIVNVIRSCPELPGNDPRQDLLYLHTLKFFMAEKEDIYNAFPHWTEGAVSRALSRKGVDIMDFNVELLGLDRRLFLEMIVDFFI